MNVSKPLAVLTIVASTLLLTAVGCKTEDRDHHMSPAQETSAVRPYPLDKCVVSGEAFEHGKPYVFVHNGQEVKLCCKDCLADFNKDPEKYMAKINAAK